MRLEGGSGRKTSVMRSQLTEKQRKLIAPILPMRARTHGAQSATGDAE
jgi:hypothetical protein